MSTSQGKFDYIRLAVHEESTGRCDGIPEENFGVDMELARGTESPTSGIQNLNDRTSTDPASKYEAKSYQDYWLA